MKFKNAPTKLILLKTIILIIGLIITTFSCKKDKEVKIDQINLSEAKEWLQSQKITTLLSLDNSRLQQFEINGKTMFTLSLPNLEFDGKIITYHTVVIYKNENGGVVGNRLYYSPTTTVKPISELLEFAIEKDNTGEQIGGIVLLYSMNGKLLKHFENLKGNQFVITKNRVQKKSIGSNYYNGKVSLTPISELSLLDYYPVPGGPATGPPAGCFDFFSVYDDGHYVTSVVFMGRRCGAIAQAQLEGDTEHWIVRPGSGDGSNGIIKPSSSQVLQILENNLFAFLLNVPCDVLKKWLTNAKFKPDQQIINKLNTVKSAQTVFTPDGPITLNDISRIQKIDDAYSTTVNMDYFSVKVNSMPKINGHVSTPTEFLQYIRTNMNSFTGGGEIFTPYNINGVNDQPLWNSSNPKGAILALDFVGPDNGSVITSYASSDKWTFTTIHEPKYGNHPVSGNRDFGYTANSDGSFSFYTRGVDRLTNWDATALQVLANVPFNQADALWTTFQNQVSSFVNTHNGSSSVVSPEILRPDWNAVKDVLDGKRPLSALSKNCPD